MPQKKNPDVGELARGRAGRAIGDLVALLAIVKSLPLSYNRDLQEDKRPLLGAADALVLTADAVAGAIETATFHADRMEEALGSGRGARHRRGRVPRRARRPVPRGARGGRQGRRVLERRGAPAREAHRGRSGGAFHPTFQKDVLRCFDARQSLARRELTGAPGPRQVTRQLARWEKALAKEGRVSRCAALACRRSSSSPAA